MSYRDSLSAASRDSKNLMKNTIGQHPVVAAVVMGGLILLVLILMFVLYTCKMKADKAAVVAVKTGFSNNLKNGSNHGGWWNGNDHAGGSGDMGRATTQVHMSHLGMAPHPRNNYRKSRREGFNAEQNDLYDIDSADRAFTGPKQWWPPQCSDPWSPDAMAEAQALATVGSFQHDTYGEDALQRTINAAYDVGGTGVSDAELQTMLHNGNTY
jgi:hypothetical protein